MARLLLLSLLGLVAICAVHGIFMDRLASKKLCADDECILFLWPELKKITMPRTVGSLMLKKDSGFTFTQSWYKKMEPENFGLAVFMEMTTRTRWAPWAISPAAWLRSNACTKKPPRKSPPRILTSSVSKKSDKLANKKETPKN